MATADVADLLSALLLKLVSFRCVCQLRLCNCISVCVVRRLFHSVRVVSRTVICLSRCCWYFLVGELAVSCHPYRGNYPSSHVVSSVASYTVRALAGQRACI